MKGRRQFLGGLLAAGLAPKPGWADIGAPILLSAAARADGRFVLCGINAKLEVCFERPLPGRGHAAAAHPNRPEAVAFARRPGLFAIVIDCVTGAAKAMLEAPQGRHFYGHGVFSADGRHLYTTENDYEAGRGCIGVWDVAAGYTRLDEWESGGVGPHDIKRITGSDTLVVANGGIDTHPDSGRAKLNIPTMRPNLAYIRAGDLKETAHLPEDLHKNSIRHLALGPYGQVAFGMQWQGDGPVSALVGVHKAQTRPELIAAPASETRKLAGYIGSIAFAADGGTIAVTSPRGGVLHVYDATSGGLVHALEIKDVCGVAALAGAYVVSSGGGTLAMTRGRSTVMQNHTGLLWDNHLIPIDGS